MEREDFRNGAGPHTAFMHYEVEPPIYETCYKEHWMDPRSIATVRKKHTASEESYENISDQYDEVFRELLSARSLLAKVAPEHIHKRRKLSDSTVDGIVQHFRKADFAEEDMEGYANDDLGEVFIGLSVSTDEDSESLTTRDE